MPNLDPGLTDLQNFDEMDECPHQENLIVQLLGRMPKLCHVKGVTPIQELAGVQLVPLRLPHY
jgi:hypothetical protein